MDLIGKSPVPVPILVIGKVAFFCCSLFFLVKMLAVDAMLFESGFTQSLGLTLYLAGFLIMIISLFQLGQSTAVGLPERETELKTHGMYRFTRNPIYLGGFVLCTGSCFFSIHPLNFLLFAITALVHHRIITREEQFLENRFGNRWLTYKQKVPRYMGRIRRPDSRGHSTPEDPWR